MAKTVVFWSWKCKFFHLPVDLLSTWCLNWAACFICTAPHDLSPPTAHHMLSYLRSQAQPLRSTSKACRCMLIATRVVGWAESDSVYVKFYGVWTTVSALVSFLAAISDSHFLRLTDVVIAEQMQLLTPEPEPRDGDINKVLNSTFLEFVEKVCLKKQHKVV